MRISSGSSTATTSSSSLRAGSLRARRRFVLYGGAWPRSSRTSPLTRQAYFRWHDASLAVRRFPILFTGLNHAMRVLGLSPGSSWVDVADESLHVQMGWAFSLRAPLAHVRDACPDDRRVLGWGVHGWRGRWLVNGSSSRIVRIDLAPPARARTGPFPITVHELRVSVNDPEGLICALAVGAATRP